MLKKWISGESDESIVVGDNSLYKTSDELNISEKDITIRFSPNKLIALLDNSKSVRVKSSDVDIVRHPVRSDFYLVTLCQEITEKPENIDFDKFYFITLWKFSETGKNPQIFFHCWQTEEDIRGEKDNLIGVEDLNIPFYQESRP